MDSPPNEPRTRSARKLRSSTSFSPTVGTTADLLVAHTDVPPWLDPPDTQDSSQTLLSRTQVQDDDGLLPFPTTEVTTLLPPELRATDDDGFIPVTATRGRGTTKTAAAFLPPETVGIPHQEGPNNAFAAFDNASLVATPDRPGEELRPVEGRKVDNLATIQAVVNKSFDEFYGPDAPSDPTSLRFKGLFDDGARMVDRILTDINEEQNRHKERTTQQLVKLRESEVYTRGTLRAEVTTLRSETEDALTLLRRETREALDKLLATTTASTSAALDLILEKTTSTLTTFHTMTVTKTEMMETLQPMVNSFAGLTSSAHRLEETVTGLLDSSARATQDILVLRRDIDGGGSLADLAELARQSEQAVKGLLETSEKNAQALRDLCQELAGCTALKATVDDIKTRQLTQLRDTLKNVTTNMADIKSQYSSLDYKYSEAFDAVNTRVDDILKEGVPPTTDHATASPSSPQTDGNSRQPPANVVPTSAPPDSGDSTNVPRSEDPAQCGGTHPGCHADRPDLPGPQEFRDTGESPSVRWRPQLDPRTSTHPQGMFQREAPTGDEYCSGPRTPTNPYFGSHDTRNESARADPRRYTAHVPLHSRRPQEVDVDYDSDDETHLPQGGQIVSPRHWDRRQVAHTAGHSPLDAVALACQAYHGYKRGYYPLTVEIIVSCG